MISSFYVRRFLRRAFNLDLVDLAADQQAIMEMMALEHARNTRDLIQHFLLAIEADLDRDVLEKDLQKGLSDLSDQVARLEEHIER